MGISFHPAAVDAINILSLLFSVVAEHPDSPVVHYTLGFALEKQNRPKAAVANYLEAIQAALKMEKKRQMTDEARAASRKAFAALERTAPGIAAVLQAADDLEFSAEDMKRSQREVAFRVAAMMRETVLKAVSSIKPEKWAMGCWNGRLWKVKDIKITQYKFHADALEIVNTTGIHTSATLVYRQPLPDTFDVELQVKGKGGVGLWPAGGQDRVCRLVMIDDGKWHRYRFRRNGGTIKSWLDNEETNLTGYKCEGMTGPLRIGVSVVNGEEIKVRRFRLEAL